MKAIEGELPPLRLEDLAPVVDRSTVRRGEPLEVDLSDSDDADLSRPHWRICILKEMTSGSLIRIAAAALEALDMVDRARESCKRLQGRVGYDIRIGSKFARQACLALCQFASRRGTDRAVAEALEKSQAKVMEMDQEIKRLNYALQMEKNARLYLLKRQKEQSREPSPCQEAGTKKDGRGQERRNTHDATSNRPGGGGDAVECHPGGEDGRRKG